MNALIVCGTAVFGFLLGWAARVTVEGEERHHRKLLLETAWGIIANVSESDWNQQRRVWVIAAERWRDMWLGREAFIHNHIDECTPANCDITPAEYEARRVHVR